jgi:hypothetical protein
MPGFEPRSLWFNIKDYSIEVNQGLRILPWTLLLICGVSLPCGSHTINTMIILSPYGQPRLMTIVLAS